MQVIFDADSLIQYLAGKEPAATKIEAFIQMQDSRIRILDVVLIKVIETLSGKHKVPKDIICDNVEGLIHNSHVSCNNTLLLNTLIFYRDSNINIVTAYVSAAVHMQGLRLYTFDKEFKKVHTIKDWLDYHH